MSKAFTKDDDDAVAPVVVPRRAPLPPGVPNYVTARGLAALRAELRELERSLERARGGTDPRGAESARRVLLEQRAELEGRIASAEVVPVPHPAPDEARFGARVAIRGPDGSERCYELVGADEADASRGRIAFFAPVARALLGKRQGDTATVRTPSGAEAVEVLSVAYDGAT